MMPVSCLVSSLRVSNGQSGRCFGLTGGVASGKSTVARMFEELGAKVIDADRLGHELYRAPLPAYKEIVSRFGSEILDSSGEIDRMRLGPIVFADAAKLRELNAILHPRIIERIEEQVLYYHAQKPHAVIVVDAALIYEAGIADRFQKILVTWCRPEQQLERLMARPACSRGSRTTHRRPDARRGKTPPGGLRD